MCGPPQNQPRAFNASDTKSWVCSQFDYNSIEKAARFWFGWTLQSAVAPPYNADLVSEENGGSTMQAMVENNADMLSDEICHVKKAKALAEGECAGDGANTSCSTALSAFHSADACAGKKSDDLMKCYNACAYSYGAPVVDGYGSLKKSFMILYTCFYVAMVVRVCFCVFFLLYGCWRYGNPDLGDPNDPDNDYNVMDGYEEEDEIELVA